MININSDTILMGTTELRTEVPKLARELKVKTVIITNRGKPIAVLEDFARYQDKKALIDNMEDLVLGKIAEARSKKSGKSDYIAQEKVFKMLGIKK
jgi:antitoxin (DNA-binding transcriptional repressor) of toxin-antitoxin stability system